MATHSGILAWEILWTEKPGGLLSMGWQRYGNDWVHVRAHTHTGHTHTHTHTATHSSTLAWRIRGMEETGRLPSLGLHRVRHDWSDLAAAYCKNFKTIYSKFFLLILCAFVVMQTYDTFIHVKVMTNLDSILKSRHCFANKGPSSQGSGFSSSHVWMWELDYKEAEHWRIDAFELWCWRKLLRVLWTARRSN